MLTIHNLENTGEIRQDEFTATGIPGEVFASADKALDERTIGHNPERINLMKVGDWDGGGYGKSERACVRDQRVDGKRVSKGPPG